MFLTPLFCQIFISSCRQPHHRPERYCLCQISKKYKWGHSLGLCSHFLLKRLAAKRQKRGQKRSFAAQKQIKLRREVGCGCVFGQFWRVCGFLFLFRRSRKKPPFLRLRRIFFLYFGVVCVSRLPTARQSQARADLGTIRSC